MSRAISLLPLWAFVACSRGNFTHEYTLFGDYRVFDVISGGTVSDHCACKG
jgi:hypothetical protein